MGPLAVRAAVAPLQGKVFRCMANLPITNLETADKVAGARYFPDEPDTFETLTGYATCGADMSLPRTSCGSSRRPTTYCHRKSPDPVSEPLQLGGHIDGQDFRISET